jgi:hypothetical protein
VVDDPRPEPKPSSEKTPPGRSYATRQAAKAALFAAEPKHQSEKNAVGVFSK